LNNYKIRVYANANTTIGQEFSFASGASIGANQVYVVAHSSANASLSSDEDYGWQFNGNDAVALYNGTSNIDIIGVIGGNANWTAGSGSTTNYLLKRKSAVLAAASINFKSVSIKIEVLIPAFLNSLITSFKYD